MITNSNANLRYPDVRRTDPVTELLPDERRLLERINDKVASAESLDSLLAFVLDATRFLQPCDRLSVAFLEEDGQRIRAYRTKTLYEPVLLGPGYVEDLQGGSLKRVVEEGRPRVINDLAAYLAEHPASRSSRLLVGEGVRSSMTCPLRVDGRTVGVLFRSARRPAAYGDRNIVMHLAIADRLSQAVEKAHRIEQL